MKDRGNSLQQSQVMAALVGIMGRFLPSVSDWYLIFQRWNVCFCWLVPLVTRYILSSSFGFLVQLTGIPLA